jgi:hypothetical protein
MSDAPRYTDRPDPPDLGEPNAVLAAYCDAVEDALDDRDGVIDDQRNAVVDAVTVLAQHLTDAIVAAAALHEDADLERSVGRALDGIDPAEGNHGAVKDAHKVLNAAATALSNSREAVGAVRLLVSTAEAAVAALLPHTPPHQAVTLWRGLWQDRTVQVQLLTALSAEARQLLTLPDVIGAPGHTMSRRPVGETFRQFFLSGGTGHDQVDGPLFRHVAAYHPAAMLAVLEHGGSVARSLGPLDLMPLLGAKDTGVRTRAIMAVSTLGLATDTQVHGGSDVREDVAPAPAMSEAARPPMQSRA